MRARVLIFLLLVWPGVFWRSARAATLVASAVEDTTLFDSQPTISDGQGPDMYVGKTGSKGTPPLRRGLIEFDLSAIPPGSTITGATLTLTMTLSGAKAGSADPISIYEVLAPWGEGGSSAAAAGGLGAPAQTNDATWTTRYFGTSQVWTNAGGDFDPVASASRTVGQVASGSSISYNWVAAGLQGDVQEWVNNPASNFGWIVLGDETKDSSARRFATAENSTSTWRPKLTVLYTVPEPATSALVFVAAGMLVVRRRRR